VKTLIQYLAVAGGGALGAVSRLFIAMVCGRLFGTAFPVGTFVINISGSLFIGWFLTVVGNRPGISETNRLAIAVGFVGAYTTFSTLIHESNSLWEEGAGIKATANLLGSLALGLIALRIGVWLGTR
jgi:fluoride exporter